GSGSSGNVFVKDLQTGNLVLVSNGLGGAQANSASSGQDISADGRFVAFASHASNLVAGDTNGFQDVFVKDLSTGALTRVSTATNGAQANSTCLAPSISGDGRYVTFVSIADNLVPGDSAHTDAFVKDLLTGATTLVSTNSAGVAGNGTSIAASISADGRYVVFKSDASNLVANDNNGAPDLFRKDLQTGATVLVSAAADGALSDADATNHGIFVLNGSSLGGVSADGRYIAFSSLATNMVPGDNNNQVDVFVKDMVTGAISLVSSSSAGVQGNDGSNGCAISANGR